MTWATCVDRKKQRLEVVLVPFSADVTWAKVALPLPMSSAEWQKFREILDVLSPGFIDDQWVTNQMEIGPPAPFAYRGFLAARPQKKKDKS